MVLVVERQVGFGAARQVPCRSLRVGADRTERRVPCRLTAAVELYDHELIDQSSISAADIRATASGAHTRIQVVSGPQAGKDILLLNTTPLQLATSNTGFVNGSRLLFGDNSPSQAGDNGDNVLAGSAGRDLMQGFGGNDSYFVSAGDILFDTGGVDHVSSSVSWNGRTARTRLLWQQTSHSSPLSSLCT